MMTLYGQGGDSTFGYRWISGVLLEFVAGTYRSGNDRVDTTNRNHNNYNEYRDY